MRSLSLRRALWASLAAHAVALGALAAMAQAHPTGPPQVLLTAKLVQLGPPKEKERLPDKSAPPTPPVPTAPISPSASAGEAPSAAATTPAKKPAGAAGRSRRATRAALERLKQRTQGAQDGAADSDARQAEVGDAYAGEMYRCLKANYVIQGVEAAQVAGRKVLVLLFVQADGRIARHRVLASSGLPVFDQAVSRAVRQCAQISPPPQWLAARLRKDGMEIEFSP